MKLGPSSSRPLDTAIAATLPSNTTGPSKELTTAVRLRRSSRISAEASASTRRRALPREPRSFGDVSTAGRLAVISNSLGARGHAAVRRGPSATAKKACSRGAGGGRGPGGGPPRPGGPPPGGGGG